jgi:hypothetical protein
LIEIDCKCLVKQIKIRTIMDQGPARIFFLNLCILRQNSESPQKIDPLPTSLAI